MGLNIQNSLPARIDNYNVGVLNELFELLLVIAKLVLVFIVATEI